MREPIEHEYFNWLRAKVLERGNANYHTLTKILFETEFVWMVSADRHRIADGLELRQDFLRETQMERDELFENQPCSVLELLIAFANRASFQTDIPAREWFWTFIINLGLDFSHVSGSERLIIDSILTTFIGRTYDPSGDGGMFPMRHTENDQREVEIWYQFCEWLDEQGLM